jgi:hypothetical protein
MMRTLGTRPFALFGALLAGASVTVAVMAAAGSDPAVWVAVAGASACACGLVVGSTAQALPAAALAGVAAAALVLAVEGGGGAAPVEVRAYAAGAAVVEDAARSPVEDAATSGGPAPATDVTSRVEPPRVEPPPPPLTRPQFVRRFYAAIDAGRFRQAWERLGPAIQARSVSFEAWRAGYATTLGNRVEELRVEPDGNVRHVLVTVDSTPCGGTTERRYEILWYLQPDGRTFMARDMVGVQLAGVDPALACG